MRSLNLQEMAVRSDILTSRALLSNRKEKRIFWGLLCLIEQKKEQKKTRKKSRKYDHVRNEVYYHKSVT